jgi:signal transduction histidine kinase
LTGEGFEIEWAAQEGECLVEADRDALEQVLLNLMDNVVKYAAEGKFIEVRVTSNHDEVSFEVADHGPGIPSEQRDRVFETFHRVDDSLTANQPGCGLGLGIARKLVEGMGGSISCEQNKPRGIRFRVIFQRRSKV